MSLPWPKFWTMWAAVALFVAWVLTAFVLKGFSGILVLVLFLAFVAAGLLYFWQSMQSS